MRRASRIPGAHGGQAEAGHRELALGQGHAGQDQAEPGVGAGVQRGGRAHRCRRAAAQHELQPAALGGGGHDGGELHRGGQQQPAAAVAVWGEQGAQQQQQQEQALRQASPPGMTLSTCAKLIVINV